MICVLYLNEAVKKNRRLSGFLGKKFRSWQNKKSRWTPLQQTRPTTEDSGWGQGHDLTWSCSKYGPLTSSWSSWKLIRNVNFGASLVVQWLRICLPIQETQVQSLLQEDPICHETAKPTHCNCWSPWALEPGLCTRDATAMRSHGLQLENSPCVPQLERKPECSNKDPLQSNI